LLHPGADERNKLAPKEEAVISMTKCAKRVSPTDAADWHPARSAADVLGDLRCFGIGHDDIVAADAVRGDGDNVPAYNILVGPIGH
jgi:hypothetical protein